jgi:transposase-like protein
VSTDHAESNATGLPPLLSKLSESQQTLVLDLQSLSVRKLDDFFVRHEMPSPGFNTISQRFIEASSTLADHLNERPLDDVDVAAIFVDATEYHGEMIYWALGATVDGQKVPLGYAIAEHEDAALVRELMKNLHRRGLKTRFSLWVVDGHRASEKVLNELPWTAVRQRCTVHKNRRVVQTHLKPKKMKKEVERHLGRKLKPKERKELKDTAEKLVYRRLRKAWEPDDPELALKRLRRVASWLVRKGQIDAAKSLMKDVRMSLTL